jgi:hypothetical protein
MGENESGRSFKDNLAYLVCNSALFGVFSYPVYSGLASLTQKTGFTENLQDVKTLQMSVGFAFGYGVFQAGRAVIGHFIGR